MSSQWINSIWFLYPASIVAMLAAAELGSRLGYRRHERRERDGGSQLSTLQTALLGLLALMIGFTFSMALTRYDARKDAVLAEADAIGTAVMEAEMLPPPFAGEVRDLLKAYVTVRTNALAGGDSIQAITGESQRLHRELWQRARAASALDPTSLPTNRFVQALDDTINLHTVRIATFLDHVPDSVFVLLYAISVVALGFTGYGIGRSGSRSRVPALLMTLCIASVILLIDDLDRPQDGLIMLNQQPLLDLRASLGE